MNRILHVGRPNIGDRQRFLERVNAMLDRNWLTNDGLLVQEFEREVARCVGAKYCVATCNATTALGILVRALGLEGEVILPSFTFVATAHALTWQGLTPVFCDVDETHNLDPEEVGKLVTARTSAILGVHLWGRPCDVPALEEIADRYDLALIFDAAHAFGCSAWGKPVGNFGDAEVFSFHATKFVNSFEGGMISTNDIALAAKARLMRNFGFAGPDRVIELGINGKMPEICAAMGLTSLESMWDFIAVNLRNHKRYWERLENLPGISLLRYDYRGQFNYQYVVVEVDGFRDELQRALWDENIMARRYFYPGCHRSEPYASKLHAPLPWTERLSERVLCLPTGTEVEEDDVDRICSLIEQAVLARC